MWFYQASPRLAIASLEAEHTAEGKQRSALSLDLRRNSLRVVAEGMSDADLAWANCVRGVLDGVLEDFPFSAMTPGVAGEGRAAGAVTVMQRAREIEIPFVAVTTADQLVNVLAPD